MGSKESQTWLDKLEEQRKPILHTTLKKMSVN